MDSHDSRKLPDEELMQVSGGEGESFDPNKTPPPCPNCGTARDVAVLSGWNSEDGKHLYLDLFCRQCKGEWTARYY